ncbi:hypothetical protein LTA6_001403 [Microbacterium sp. LTA6]|uniref:Ig-like domain-containing protein n=1 Tax=Microbacterium sp. LTA6 TaxID=3129771 RepID=UPI00324994AF
MSTDEERPEETPAIPRTRAEMRAAREAAEAAAAAETQASTPAPASDPVSASDPDPAQASVPAAAPEPVPASDPVPASAPDPVPAPASDPVLATLSAEITVVGRNAEVPTDIRDLSRQSDDARREGIPAEGVPPEDTPPAKASPVRPNRRFLVALAAVVGVLVLVGAGLGAASLVQGPRLTSTQVDPEEAIDSSGSRVILTANQALADIDPAQVTVEPAVPFTVDAAGRGVGIRFTVPLDDSTKYTVTVNDAVGVGGGPSADLTTSFKTPASSIYLLRRDADGKDKIFRTDLSGEKAVPVFSHERINDFRATSTQLVVSVAEGKDDLSRLLVMDRNGKNERELSLPGEGYVGAIQVSERGGLVGYSYSDRELSDTSGRASVLVTQSLNSDDKPQVVEVGDKEASIFSWQFVPDSAAVLFIDFDGALALVDHSSDAGVQSLGLAATIQGISRGTYTAIVERVDGAVVELNLADGSEEPLEASDPDYGIATTITPFPGGTLRHIVARNDVGMPTGQAIIRVDDKGAAEPLVEVGSTDSILQACASPSGQYAAVVIAPELVDNPYDDMLLPLPRTLETHLIDLASGKELVALTGFDASWCQTAPRF